MPVGDRDFLTQTHQQDPKNKVEVRQTSRKGLPAGLGDSPVEDGAGDWERRRSEKPYLVAQSTRMRGSQRPCWQRQVGPPSLLLAPSPGPAQ